MKILYHKKARMALLAGVNKLANAVKTTLGPGGRNAILDKDKYRIFSTKDGVTVAREIELEDPTENAGAKLVKQVALKTNDVVGDGTTTATLLAQEIANAGIKAVNGNWIFQGISPVEIKKGIEVAAEKVIEIVKIFSKPIKDIKDIEFVARISANDKEVGDKIADLRYKIGKEGIITLEEGKKFGIETELTSGFKFNSGAESPYFFNVNAMAVLEDPYILITDNHVRVLEDIESLISQLASEGKRELVIIAEDFSPEMIALMVFNTLDKNLINQNKQFRFLAIRAPEYKDKKKEILEDIATLTGGKFISEEKGMKVKDVKIEDLGHAGVIIAYQSETIIKEGAGASEAVAARVISLKAQITDESTEFDESKLKERVARLTGKIGVVKIGGATDAEKIELKHRIEDSVSATKAAMEDGIVAGGGTVLALAAEQVLRETVYKSYGEMKGVKIFCDALKSPVRTIANNAGANGNRVLSEVLNINDFNYGYNASTGEFGNLIEMGVIDPTKVVVSTIQNAISIAGLLLITEVLTVNEIK